MMAGNPATTIVLTRPRAQSEAFARILKARFGDRVNVVFAPLLEIVPCPGAIDLSGVRELIFTSTNGVAAFADRCDRRDLPATCVGDRTCDAAVAAGLKARSAGGDADDLVRLILTGGPDTGGTRLHLRGRNASGALAERLSAAGISCREQVLYDQRPLTLDSSVRSLLEGGPGIVAPLFSPRTAVLFAEAAAGFDPSNVQAVCLSRNVAERVATIGLKSVRVSSVPTAEGVVAEIAAII